LDFVVRVTRPRWQLIAAIKHPVMAGREAEVKIALEAPEEIRQSRKDRSVFLFYRAERAKRWICAVVKREDSEGFLITAYLTGAIKEGARVWPR
jgi:hypothetical protein